ncbi:enoyl-CoA hydratase-related protein [soil metagenome]
MTSIDTEQAILTRTEAGVAWITLNRATRMNAFAGSMREALCRAIEAAAHDDGMRAIVLTGSGTAFSAGADIDAMADLLARDDTDAFRQNVEAGMRVARAIAAAPQPVIAALNGVAVGAGASLAIACDLRIASDSARIGFTFNRIGLHPDWGATYFLPRLVGRGRAAELIFSARILEATEAADLGIIEEVVPSAAFSERVAELVRGLAAKPPLALSSAKRSLAAASGGSDRLEAALQNEAEAQMRCFASSDVREGIAAFREKRQPQFTGR